MSSLLFVTHSHSWRIHICKIRGVWALFSSLILSCSLTLTLSHSQTQWYWVLVENIVSFIGLFCKRDLWFQYQRESGTAYEGTRESARARERERTRGRDKLSLSDSFASEIWLMTHSYCDVTHSYVTWLIHMCDVTHSYVCHDSFTCATWLIHMCDMTHSYVAWLIHMCDMTHLYVRHDSLMCATWHIPVWLVIHTCDMTHSYMWHDSFICATWLIHIWDMTREQRDSLSDHELWSRTLITNSYTVRWRDTRTFWWIMSHMWMSHVTLTKWVKSHIWMRHVAHMNESCHNESCHKRMSRVSDRNTSSHIAMSCVTHI